MNSSDISLGVILRELGCFKLDNLEDRLLIQKKVYLLINNQKAHMSYNYNWYVHGPYCPALTRDCYRIIPEGKKNFKQYTLTDIYQEKINSVNNYDSYRPQDLNITSWYELLASVLYINLEFGFFGIKEHQQIARKIQELKPQRFSDNNIEQAIKLLSL